MSFEASPADATGRLNQCETRQTSCGNACQQDSPRNLAAHTCCGDSCCHRCASTIEQTISDRVQQLLAGRDREQELPFSPASRLACLPLTASSYRFLKQQFRIVNDYLSQNDVSNTGNRWGAIFHLRLISGRIRAARQLSTKVVANCNEVAVDSEGCVC
jgi:hypothetical protein